MDNGIVFSAVIYNDWHVVPDIQTFGVFPILGLWYSGKATSDFKDFRLLGMGADIGNMESPGDPLKDEIGEDDHPFIDIGDIIDFDFDSFSDFVDSLKAASNDILMPWCWQHNQSFWR